MLFGNQANLYAYRSAPRFVFEAERADDALHARTAMRTTRGQHHFARPGQVRNQQTRRGVFSCFDPRSPVARRAIKNVAHGLINDSEDTLAADGQPNLHGKITVAINEVLRSIHRIDQPHSILVQPVRGVGRLFGENSVVRKFLLQPANNQFVRLAIGSGDLFEFIEGVHLLLDQKRTVVMLKQDGARLAG